MSSPSFKELQHHEPHKSLYVIEHEMMNEDNVKNAILNGQGNQQIIDAYKVDNDFVDTCRKELVIDGGI